jgi:hypothetical protein
MGHYDEAERELQRIESNFRLQNLHTAPAELLRLVNEELRAQGIDPTALRANIAARKEADDDATRAKIFAAAAKFKASRPESDSVNGFVPCEANENVVLHYMGHHGLDPTSPHSFEEAFLAVRDRLIPPARQKRRTPQVRKVNGREISHESLDRLSAKDMERLMQNPAFLNAVNALPPRTRP